MLGAVSIGCMATPPKQPNVLIGLGVAFLVLGLIALRMFLGDPAGATGRGIPVWFAVPTLGIGGVGFIIYGAYWRSRGRGGSSTPDGEG